LLSDKFKHVVGKKAKKNLNKYNPINFEDLE